MTTDNEKRIALKILENFYNEGFGWVCKQCERELKERESSKARKYSRLLREGEAESKNPRLSNPALAKWMDESRRTLVCPRCGITGSVNKF
ncbi:MAG TPA: hypothetical protein VK892_04630 [Pyrinomonadaceae bacterium]|nr:hypothetical protein [Pyrinomonadaceae bacterium]